VGGTRLELVTSSVSGNLYRRLCLRIMAVSCHDSSTQVRWCPLLSPLIVTQLVTRTGLTQYAMSRVTHHNGCPSGDERCRVGRRGCRPWGGDRNYDRLRGACCGIHSMAVRKPIQKKISRLPRVPAGAHAMAYDGMLVAGPLHRAGRISTRLAAPISCERLRSCPDLPGVLTTYPVHLEPSPRHNMLVENPKFLRS
jgi:hypothetical protein